MKNLRLPVVRLWGVGPAQLLGKIIGICHVLFMIVVSALQINICRPVIGNPPPCREPHIMAGGYSGLVQELPNEDLGGLLINREATAYWPR